MQTFLPYPDFRQSLECLDKKRLGKQRVEASQIIEALTVPGAGWKAHPATKMWIGYVNALKLYYNTSLDVWRERGGRNILLEHAMILGPIVMPYWIGDAEFHRSHQSNLKRKDPIHYTFDVPDNLPYIWPNNDSSR